MPRPPLAEARDGTIGEAHVAEDILLGVVDATLPSAGVRPPRRFPATLYRYVWRVSRPQQIRLILLTLLVLPLSMAPLELQRRIVDDAVMNEHLGLLVQLCGVYLAVALGTVALKFARSVYEGRISESVIRSLRQALSHHDFKADGNGHGGSAVSMVASEAEQIGAFVGESLSFPLLQAGTLVAVMGYMLVVEPLIALFAFALFLPSLLITPWIQRRLNDLVGRRTVVLRELGDLIAAEGETHGESRIREIYRVRMRILVLKYLVKLVNNLVGHLGPIGVLLFGGWMVIEGRTELGVVVAFISGFEKIMDPARELLNFYRRMAQMRVQYRLIVAAMRGEAA
ncbi:MAG: ABC transporter ATP-binding protein [Proteobacteria bacterium]|nr:ABC transporter ATP-binding protein [Pseudomonadota bacterium]